MKPRLKHLWGRNIPRQTFQELEGRNAKTEIGITCNFHNNNFILLFFYITENISFNASLLFRFTYFSPFNSEKKSNDQLKCLRQVTGCTTRVPCRLFVDEDLNCRLLLCPSAATVHCPWPASAFRFTVLELCPISKHRITHTFSKFPPEYS